MNNLIAKYFNSQTIDYELSIIPEWYILYISLLTSYELDRIVHATNQVCVICWVGVCTLASDCTHLIEMPKAIFFHVH